jgi:hypothetical protein
VSDHSNENQSLSIMEIKTGLSEVEAVRILLPQKLIAYLLNPGDADTLTTGETRSISAF